MTGLQRGIITWENGIFFEKRLSVRSTHVGDEDYLFGEAAFVEGRLQQMLIPAINRMPFLVCQNIALNIHPSSSQPYN